MEFIRDPKLRDAKKALWNNRMIQDLKEEFTEKLEKGIEFHIKIDEINLDEELYEHARYVAATYDWLGFILDEDDDLQEKMMDTHGDTIAAMWKMLARIVTEKFRAGDQGCYASMFEKIGTKALTRHPSARHTPLLKRDDGHLVDSHGTVWD